VAAFPERRDARRASAHAEAAASVGSLSDRDLLILGAAIYWCEGAKSKPWRPVEKIQFTNSDPMLLDLFLRFLESQGHGRNSPTYRVTIHESADHERAVDWWLERLALPRERCQRTTFEAACAEDQQAEHRIGLPRMLGDQRAQGSGAVLADRGGNARLPTRRS
jgi:hypothetical protein